MPESSCCPLQTTGCGNLEEAALSLCALVLRKCFPPGTWVSGAAPTVFHQEAGPGMPLPGPRHPLCPPLPPPPFCWVRRQPGSPALSCQHIPAAGLSAHSSSGFPHQCSRLSPELSLREQHPERSLGCCLFCTTTSLTQTVNVVGAGSLPEWKGEIGPKTQSKMYSLVLLPPLGNTRMAVSAGRAWSWCVTRPDLRKLGATLKSEARASIYRTQQLLHSGSIERGEAGTQFVSGGVYYKLRLEGIT